VTLLVVLTLCCGRS